MQKNLQLIPDYYNKFHCIGGACEDTCCAGWKIDIDRISYKNYQSLPKSEFKTKLKQNMKKSKSPSDVQYAFFQKNDQGCMMLSEDNLCTIQQELGENALCRTCKLYPRSIKAVNQTIEKCLDVSCPEAARLILLNPEGIGFIEDNIEGYSEATAAIKLSEQQLEFFWAARIGAIDILQERSQTIELRLVALGLFIKKLDELKSEGKLEQTQLFGEYYKDILKKSQLNKILSDDSTQDILKIKLVKALLDYERLETFENRRFIECMQEFSKGIQIESVSDQLGMQAYQMADKQFYQPYMIEHEYILENYLVNTLFKMAFPAQATNTFYDAYIDLLSRFTLIKLFLVGIAGANKGLNDDNVIKLIQSFSKSIEHSNKHIKMIQQFFKEEKFTSVAHFYVLIK